MANSPLPQDLRDLVIRLDQRVEDGLSNIMAMLTAYAARTDALEREQARIVLKLSEIEITAKHLAMAVKIVGGTVGTIALGLVSNWLGIGPA